MKYLAAILLAVSTSTYADELLLTTFSWHERPYYNQIEYTGKQYFGIDGKIRPLPVEVRTRYNDVNIGLGYKLDNGVLAGFYYNSFNRSTFYAGYEYLLTPHFGAVAYAATGYGPEMGHKLVAVGGLEYKIPLTNKWTANILGIPPLGKVSGVANLTFSYGLGN